MQPTRRDVLAAGLALSLSSPGGAQGVPLPATGDSDETLRGFDDLMLACLQKHSVPGAALAITHKGRLVHARGYGHADLDRKIPVTPTSLFRIASITKSLTAVAVLRLVDAGKLGLDDKLVDRIVVPQPLPGERMDPRWRKITLRMLLQHNAGWDWTKSFEPASMPLEIANAFGVRPPVPPALVIRFMAGKPLDFEPGGRYAYSNFGYLLLGRVIERASGVDYQAYVQREVMKPLGVTTARFGRALPEFRPANEVQYHEVKRRQGPCLYPPRRGRLVLLPDGADNFEHFDSHGGWIASAIDLVRFASAFDDPKASPLLKEATIASMWERPVGEAGQLADGKPKGNYYGLGWNYRPVTETRGTAWHGGYINGTATVLVRRTDDINWAVLFNADLDADGNVLTGLVERPLHDTANLLKTWPEMDLFGKYLK